MSTFDRCEILFNNFEPLPDSCYAHLSEVQRVPQILEKYLNGFNTWPSIYSGWIYSFYHLGGHHIGLLDPFKNKNTSVRGLITPLSYFDDDISSKSNVMFFGQI